MPDELDDYGDPDFLAIDGEEDGDPALLPVSGSGEPSAPALTVEMIEGMSDAQILALGDSAQAVVDGVEPDPPSDAEIGERFERARAEEERQAHLTFAREEMAKIQSQREADRAVFQRTLDEAAAQQGAEAVASDEFDWNSVPEDQFRQMLEYQDTGVWPTEALSSDQLKAQFARIAPGQEDI